MTRCELCNSEDLVIAKVKKNSVVIGICRECGSVYEIDENHKIVLGHDPDDTEYFEKLQALFNTWDDVTDIVPYNK